jgi:hypothetical protein
MSALLTVGQPAVPSLIEAAMKERGHIRPAELTLERIDPHAADKMKLERKALEERERNAP